MIIMILTVYVLQRYIVRNCTSSNIHTNYVVTYKYLTNRYTIYMGWKSASAQCVYACNGTGVNYSKYLETFVKTVSNVGSTKLFS